MSAWQRRARPLLGTLVEVGLPAGDADGPAFDAAFAALAHAQACLSRFEPDSDLGRFHALPRGGQLLLRPVTQAVLAAAQALREASEGGFDISLGTAPEGWALDGDRLIRLSEQTRLDLGGIGKGHAVDLAVQALQEAGCDAGWVNAGGDLRAFGDVELPLQLRDEAQGGVRPCGWLRDGAFATSAFGHGHRTQLAPRARPGPGAPATPRHVSVAAPLCLWADALTKLVALDAPCAPALLARHGAQAWCH